jgi:hypothetical protein
VAVATTGTGFGIPPVDGLVMFATGRWLGVSHGSVVVVVVVVVVVLVVDVVDVVDVVEVVVVVVVVDVVVVVVVVVVGGVSLPPARIAAAPPPTTAAPPAIRTGDTAAPPAAKPTGAAPVTEPITTLPDSAIGASGPMEQLPFSTTSTLASRVRASEELRSVAEM